MRLIGQSRARLSEVTDAQREVDEQRRAAKRAALWQRHERDLIQQFYDAGVEPPDERGMLVSLPMRLKMGWRIEVVNGARVLVAPGRWRPGDALSEKGMADASSTR